jgi:cyanophycin synthetase
MRIESIRTISGPNVYSHKPVLVMRLDLEHLTGRESHEVDGFVDRLLGAIPGLSEHTCGLGYRGGFVERLREGTYFGHVVEHVAIEMSHAAGIGVDHGKTRSAGPPHLYDVVVEYAAEHGMRRLVEAAVACVEALVAGKPFPIDEHVEDARHIADRSELGPSTRAIVEAAARRGIPWRRVGAGSLVQLGYGRHRRHVQAAVSDRTPLIAADVACDKELTKRLLEAAAIPVPRGVLARTEAEACEALEDLEPPLVAKPLDGQQGKGVSLGLRTADEVAAAYRHARAFSSSVLVEESLTGRDFRVLVVDGRMVAAAERIPAHVMGDGEHTIRDLVEIANRDPRRGEGHARPLTRIEIDEASLASLSRRGYTPESVPPAGERVVLHQNANLSKGGTARDVTDEVHPSVARMCERAARTIGLDVCGVDVVTEDISRPLERGRGGVVELNAAPGLRMHLSPCEGAPRDVGAAVVEMLYPEGAPSRIPIVAITGTNGKTTTTRMIGHTAASTGAVAGVATTDGVWIGGECVAEGDLTGPYAAGLVLSDPAVEVAVLETARGGIARRGLGWDWCDVAVMTNVQADHIGQDGIRSIDDLLWVKSLVAERVREGGTLVLNADDERLASLADEPRIARVPKQVVYFSLRESSVVVHRHLSRGGTAFFVRDGWIVEADPTGERRVAAVADIPATMGGAAEFHVANAIAAAAASRALGIETERIAAALATFDHNAANPGRTNLFRVGAGHVLVDYGHNADGYRAVARMASRVASGRVTSVITLPGDRADEVLVEAARAAANGFDRVVISEDHDLRGRAPGELPRLLAETVRAERPDRECVVMPDECAAVESEIARMGPGDLVVVFYEKLGPILETLARHGAAPAEGAALRAGLDRLSA